MHYFEFGIKQFRESVLMDNAVEGFYEDSSRTCWIFEVVSEVLHMDPGGLDVVRVGSSLLVSEACEGAVENGSDVGAG